MQTESTGFEKIVKSYIGFLEGTGKSRLTISSYKGDLEVFRDFMDEAGLQFFELKSEDFDRYHQYLVRQGMKTNTRRRKLITARSLCKYAFIRKKLDFSPAQFVKPPERLEKLPWVPKPDEYKQFVKAFSYKTPIEQRNRILVEMIAELALAISELCSLQWTDIDKNYLNIPGKRRRTLELSKNIVYHLSEWRLSNSGKYLFPGYNRHGFTSPRMTPRGVELMFRTMACRTGFPETKPKTLRHFAILEWLRNGISDAEVQRRLGVSSAYSLQAYKQYLGIPSVSS